MYFVDSPLTQEASSQVLLTFPLSSRMTFARLLPSSGFICLKNRQVEPLWTILKYFWYLKIKVTNIPSIYSPRLFLSWGKWLQLSEAQFPHLSKVRWIIFWIGLPCKKWSEAEAAWTCEFEVSLVCLVSCMLRSETVSKEKCCSEG